MSERTDGSQSSDDGLRCGVLLTQRDVAERLKVSVRTLERARAAGNGPQYHKLGHLVRYIAADVDRWVAGLAVTSTSQSRPGR